MQKALRHTVIIDFSHYVQQKLLFRRFKSGVFQPHFGAYSRCERRYPYIKGCNSGASQKILWKQVVTCSAHSTEHFKTNLAEYRGEGDCTVGQIIFRTITSVFVCNHTPSPLNPLIPRPLSPWFIGIQWVASRDVLQYRTWKKTISSDIKTREIPQLSGGQGSSTFSNSQYESVGHVCTWEIVPRRRGVQVVNLYSSWLESLWSVTTKDKAPFLHSRKANVHQHQQWAN